MRKYLLGSMFFMIASQVPAQWNGNNTVNNVVANSSANEFTDAAVTDDANGSIVLCTDFNGSGDMYVQKISVAGAIAWGTAATPVPLCVTQTDKSEANMIPDGSGGAYIAWTDYRFNDNASEVYIQHINSAGAVQWAANGLRGN